MTDYYLFFADLHLHEWRQKGMFEQGLAVAKAISNAKDVLQAKGHTVNLFFLGDLAEGVIVRGRRAFTPNVLSAAADIDLGYCVPGNHDTDSLSGNTWLNLMTSGNDRVVANKPTMLTYTQSEHTVGFIALPYAPMSSLKECLSNVHTISGFDQDMWDSLDYRLLIGHFGVIGADVGGADWIGELSVDDLPIQELGLDHVILGHYHIPQDVTDQIHYCGSPMQLKAGERLPDGIKRGFIAVKVDEKGMKLRRVPINSKSLVSETNKREPEPEPLSTVQDRANKIDPESSQQEMVLEYLREKVGEPDDLTAELVTAVFEGVNSSERWDKTPNQK